MKVERFIKTIDNKISILKSQTIFSVDITDGFFCLVAGYIFYQSNLYHSNSISHLNGVTTCCTEKSSKEVYSTQSHFFVWTGSVYLNMEFLARRRFLKLKHCFQNDISDEIPIFILVIHINCNLYIHCKLVNANQNL